MATKLSLLFLFGGCIFVVFKPTPGGISSLVDCPWNCVPDSTEEYGTSKILERNERIVQTFEQKRTHEKRANLREDYLLAKSAT